ncbi:DUF3040 domain-containing protein [Streptomyces sp. NPDC058335]|uniref:DUF3040 domain-containing protein n=1 Tax=Streptomyces sp. NPDC058335 TaxID=3346451 RepID=UPI0036647B64
MSATDDERLTDLAASTARDDPRCARSPDEGRPAPPREYRRVRGWCGLTVATAALIAGVVLPHGLLLAAGLVLAALSAQFFDSHLFRPRRRSPRG